ncbi:hypothetical protein X566_15410 [Afipia sp. P52-10]|nr:hypothetical protein X566_15410 [Afipia sp. P52-10]
MTEINQLAPWVAIVIALAAFLRPIISDRSKDIDGKLASLETRITRVETDIKHLPDHATVTSLERMVGNLGKEVAVLSERIKPIAAISDQLQDVLLEKAKAGL